MHWCMQAKPSQFAFARTELLEARKCLQGGEHPDTLKAAVNVARACCDTGDYKNAKKIASEVSIRLLATVAWMS